MIRMTEQALNDFNKRNATKAVKPSTSVTRMQALGRLKTGVMNKTELAYEAHLFMRKVVGEVLWYKFEGLKFRLADNTMYTPDFSVLVANGQLEAHEVKGGYWQDDARVKIKVAADMYPIKFIGVMPKPKKVGGGWAFEEF